MSSFKKQEIYIPEKCSCCGQSITYLLPIDKGTTDILRAVARAIMNKGINAIHPRKEMEVDLGVDSSYELMVQAGKLTSNMVGNLSRPRFHGLIAKIKEQPGNYCLTRKGAAFLKGDIIPKYAIVNKALKHQTGYWMEEKYQATIKDFSRNEEYWEGLDYDIREGQVLTKVVKNPATQNQLFV